MQRGFFMPQNFYELVWIFIIYAFIGWCTEVSYAALDTGKFVNRGFLNGPYCPIYGCGVVIVVAALTPLQDNLLILFIGSFALTTALEFITGFLLEKVFHNKWWDYSNKPFNVKGYICLEFSVLWGLACTFIMKVIHPMIYKFITIIPHMIGVVLLVILMTAFAVDLCVTVSTILKFNKRLKLMDEMAKKMHELSDEIGENIYESVTTVKEKSEEFQDTHEELITKISDNLTEAKSEYTAKKQAFAEKTNAVKEEFEDKYEEMQKELEELNRKYKDLLDKKTFGFKRLIKAFPDMTSRDQNEILQKYKKYFESKKEEK